jgi:hypothetical protein
MRSIRLGRALAATATLLALAPAGAAAAASHPKHRDAGSVSCRVSLHVEERLITSGDLVNVSGTLGCPPGAPASPTVSIFEHSGGTPGVKMIGTATPAQNGFFSILPVPVTLDSYFYAAVLGAHSRVVRVAVAPTVELVGPPEGTQLFTTARGLGLGPKHNAVTFTGKVEPAPEVGAQVVLQREDGTANEQWHAIQRGHVGPGGVFTLIHNFIVPGDANLRVLVRPHGRFTVRGESTPLSYEISQEENPKLTINSSADPVPYEQPVTITGTLEKGAFQPVTLQGHPRGNPGFTTVEKATTNEKGEYTFTIAKALRNTYYKVTATGQSSAILYEGVKYVLTPNAPPSTTSSGSLVTFTGTVTPVHVNHPVYLERQSTLGSGGYHVVALGRVEGTGSYKIEHLVVGSGKETYRIRIPGDPENQAAFGSPFTIEVTPSMATTLRPVKPSVLPSEGQV